MKSVYVVSENIISPLGFTTEENFNSLKNNLSGIQPFKRSALPNLFCASAIDKNVLSGRLNELLKSYTFFEQLCILSISNALEKIAFQINHHDTILILSTTKGNVELMRKDKPTDSRLYLHHSAKAILNYFQLTTEALVVSNACVSGVSALNLAARLLQKNLYKNAIVCGADVLSSFTLSGFESFKALSEEACRPFDANRNGTSLGEGAASIVLSNIEKSEIEILSGASSNDANHISGPSRSGDGLQIAIEKTLKLAENPKVDFISAHGTGTIYNDEMESKALNLCSLQHLPVNSLKGYYGHTFGAAGIIESVVSIESMRQNMMIPTKGFETACEAIQLNIPKSILHSQLDCCLKTASGFGGSNAAVVFVKRK